MVYSHAYLVPGTYKVRTTRERRAYFSQTVMPRIPGTKILNLLCCYRCCRSHTRVPIQAHRQNLVRIILVTMPVIDTAVVLIPDSHWKSPMGSMGTHGIPSCPMGARDTSHGNLWEVPWEPTVPVVYHVKSQSFPRDTTGISRDSMVVMGPSSNS